MAMDGTFGVCARSHEGYYGAIGAGSCCRALRNRANHRQTMLVKLLSAEDEPEVGAVHLLAEGRVEIKVHDIPTVG